MAEPKPSATLSVPKISLERARAPGSKVDDFAIDTQSPDWNVSPPDWNVSRKPRRSMGEDDAFRRRSSGLRFARFSHSSPALGDAIWRVISGGDPVFRKIERSSEKTLSKTLTTAEVISGRLFARPVEFT